MTAPQPSRAFVPVLLAVGSVVSVVSSLGAPLIPEIARQFNTTLGTAQWALTATLVVGAVSSPLLGRLGDGPRRRGVLVCGLALVVVGGVLAAVAPSISVLVLGRALQGFGLALLPLTMAAARDALPAAQAGRVIALLSVVGAAGVGLGYPLTGLIADHGGVAAAYWFGTALSAAALVAAWSAIPAAAAPRRGEPLDLPGAVLAGAGLVALLIGLEKGGDWGWGTGRTLVLLVAGAGLLAAWGRHELRSPHPLVDLRLARHRAVLTANVSGLLLGVTMYLSLASITQLVQEPTFGMGQSVFVAGLALVPLSVFSTSVSRSVPWVQARVGTRAMLTGGALAVMTGTGLMGLTSTALWQVFVATGILGIGLGYTFAALPGLIVSSVPPQETGSAMGFYQVARFIGFAVGSGLAVTLLRAFGTDGVPDLSAYQSTALVGAGVGAATAAVAWVLLGRGRAPVSPAAVELEREEARLGAAGLEDLSAAR